MSGDTTLSAVAPPEAMSRVLAPVLTIALHPDPSRIGERAFLLDEVAEVSRLSPGFAATRDGESRPLEDRHLSREPVRIEIGEDEIVVRGDLVIEGQPRSEVTTLARDGLKRGVVLELGGRVILLLHEADPLAKRQESLGLVGRSQALFEVRQQIARVGALSVPVLLRGETGTGKELVARALHRTSSRASGPFVAVNLAAIPAPVVASELFGHRRGAFTGAVDDSPGLFGRADGGTIFLDEVGDASDDVQLALLRVLEVGEIQPVGAAEARPVDLRIVAATDADLEHRIDEGRFRRPLLERLRGFTIALAPLRERREDIPPLMVHMIRSMLDELGHAERLDPTPPGQAPWLSLAVMRAALRYDWPGNVRELRNVARAVAVQAWDAPAILPSHVASLPMRSSIPEASEAIRRPSSPPRRRKLDDISEDEIREALEACDYRTAAAAKRLGVAKSSLYALINDSDLLRKAADLTDEEIRAALEAQGGDLVKAARALKVSSRGLKLRMSKEQP